MIKNLIEFHEIIFISPDIFTLIRIVFFITVSLYSMITDVKKKEVNGIVLLVLTIVFCISWLFIDLRAFIYSLSGAAGIACIFLFISFVSQGGIGLGDMLYLTFYSSLFGVIFTLFSFLFSFWIATLVLIIPYKMNKLDKNTRIPFVPFLFTGSVMSLLLIFI